MGPIASQITSLTIVYSTVYSDADQRKHQRSASLAFVRGIHRGPVNSPHKWPVTRKMFPFDDVIMQTTPHIALTGDLWGVFSEFFEKRHEKSRVHCTVLALTQTSNHTGDTLYPVWSLYFKWVKHSAWIRRLGGSSPPQIETFSVSKALTLSQEHRKWMRMRIVLTLTYPICFVFVPCVSGTYFIRYFTTLAGSPNGFPRGCKFMVVVPIVTNP